MLGGASEKRAAPVCIIPKDKLLAWKLNPITYAWPLLHSQVQKSSFRLPPRNARRRYKNFSVCLESESHVCVIHFSQMENKAATGAAFFRPPAHSLLSILNKLGGWNKSQAPVLVNHRARGCHLYLSQQCPLNYWKSADSMHTYTALRLTAHSVKCFQLFTLQERRKFASTHPSECRADLRNSDLRFFALQTHVDAQRLRNFSQLTRFCSSAGNTWIQRTGKLF